MSTSIWEKSNGMWTAASYAARAICRSSELTAAEQYFILVSLGIDERFKDFWNHPKFFERAGMADHASGALSPQRDGRIAATGDYAWARGDIAEAVRRYEASIAANESTASGGVGGLIKIHFFLGDYEKCISRFRQACPPHAFYVEYHKLFGADTSAGMEPFNRLSAQFPGTSPYVLTQAKYMCRAVVAAAVRAGGIDDQLREMISDFFEIEPTQVDELAKALATDGEIPKLRKRIAPKPINGPSSLAELMAEGDTERARRMCELLPRSVSLADPVTDQLDAFLDSGDPSRLDEMAIAAAPFGIEEADRFVLGEALERRKAEIIAKPARRLFLLRRFRATYDFLGDYMEIMRHVDAEIEPGDVITAILDLQWYKTPYKVDDTGPMGKPGGFGKTEISDNREWLEIVLRDHVEIFDRAHLANRDAAVAALHRAYQFLRERFMDVRRDERWISEAQLGDALATLFGKDEVQRHARPLWLSPQHLDYFLPRYAVAIEYMGEQHYEPIGVFGGPAALEATKIRDERKRDLCQRMGVTLVYVTHAEDVGQRAREIHGQVASKKQGH